MSLAEQKKELLRIVNEADEEFMGKLIAFAKRLTTGDEDTPEEVIKAYEKRTRDFFESGEKGFSKEESLAQLRNLLK